MNYAAICRNIYGFKQFCGAVRSSDTSYVTMRDDFPNIDPHMQWDRLVTN